MKLKVIVTFAGLIAIGVCSHRLVLAETKVSQEIVTGVQQKQVNSPESKFEEYGEIPNGPVIGHYGLNAEGEETTFEFDADHVRQDNQSADFEIKGARYKVNGTYNQTPHLFSTESRTLFNDDGHGNLTLPNPIQSALQAGGTTQFVTNFSSFAAGAHLQELKTLRSKGGLGLDFDLTDALKLNVGASEEMKKGYMAKGMRIDADPTEFARPVDFKTYNSNLGLGYTGKKVQWGFNYNFSSFKDGLDSITIDNPITLNSIATKSGTGRISLEPDNYEHSVNLDGGVSLPVHSRFTAKASFNYMRQDQNLIPYTSNLAISPAPPSSLPTDRANARSLNWVQDYDLSSKPLKSWDLGVRLHSDQLHNKTPELNFPGYIDTESVFKATPVSNEPFSYRKNSLTGRTGWKVADPLHLNVKYGTEWINRSDREVKKNHENTLNFSADYQPLHSTLVRASYINARRRMSDFSEDANQIPNIRLADISDRDRNQGNLLVQVNSDRFSVSLNGGLGHDRYFPGKGDLTAGDTNYPNIMEGLLDTRMALGGVDFDFDVSERIDVNTYYEYQQDKTILAVDDKSSKQTSPDQGQFTQRQDTRYDTGGVGINIRAIRSFLDIKVGYDVTSSKANYDFLTLDSINANNSVAGNGLKTSPPETKTTKQDFSIKGKVAATSNLSVTLAYLFEKYDVFDWATDNLGLIAPAASGQENIFLGDATHDYKAHIVSVIADYKF